MDFSPEAEFTRAMDLIAYKVAERKAQWGVFYIETVVRFITGH